MDDKRTISALWTRENISWLAGLLEGEGCFQVRNGCSIDITLNMTDRDVVERAHSVSGVGYFLGPYLRGDYKPIWRWRVSRGDHVYAICVAVLPFMLARRSAKILEVMSAFVAQGTQEGRLCGWNAKYLKGCRCEECRAARATYVRKVKARVAERMAA